MVRMALFHKPKPATSAISILEWGPDRTSSLANSNKYMLDNEDGCDVTLIVKGPNDVTETRILAHRYVLCSRSPEFYRLLWTGKAANEKKLKITDTSSEVLRQIIRFLYCEEAEITAENVISVLNSARRYHADGLASRCLEFVGASLTVSNACAFLERCIEISESSLADTCLQFISSNSEAVFESESFIRSSVEVVRHIASLDWLSVGEIELFEACVAWAKSRDTGGDADRLRQLLSPIVDSIRFPTMSPDDFARRVVPLNILTDSETCNVYKYFTCPEKPQKRFVTVKRKRPTGSGGLLYPDVDDANA